MTQDLARIKIWNSRYKVIYSDDHSLIGRTLPPSDDLLHALAGEPDDADVVTPRPHTETASEVGSGNSWRCTCRCASPPPARRKAHLRSTSAIAR